VGTFLRHNDERQRAKKFLGVCSSRINLICSYHRRCWCWWSWWWCMVSLFKSCHT